MVESPRLFCGAEHVVVPRSWTPMLSPVKAAATCIALDTAHGSSHQDFDSHAKSSTIHIAGTPTMVAAFFSEVSERERKEPGKLQLELCGVRGLCKSPREPQYLQLHKRPCRPKVQKQPNGRAREKNKQLCGDKQTRLWKRSLR